MAEIRDKLDLTIHIAPQGEDAFRLQLSSPAGEAETQIARDAFLSPEFRQQLRQIDERRLWGEEATRLGRELYSHLFPTPLDANLERARALVGPDPLRLLVHCELPEVAAVPWELLFDPRRRLFLALDPATGLVRQTAQPETTPEWRAGTTLRILAVQPSPVDAPALDLEATRQALQEALSSFVEAGRVTIDFVPSPVTVETIEQRLAETPYDVLYFAGHSADRALLLENEQRRSHVLPAERLLQLLQRQLPRLAVLSADRTAAPTAGSGAARLRADDEASPPLAVALVQAGVPLVVGMQTAIRERAASAFDVALFGGLAEGLPVDRAVTHARRQLYLQASDRLDWVAPVLYTAGASLGPLVVSSARTATPRLEVAGLAVSNVGGLASVDRYDLNSRRMNVQQTVEVIGSQPAALAGEAGERPGRAPSPGDAGLDFSFGTPGGARPDPTTTPEDSPLSRPQGGRRGIDEPATAGSPPSRLAAGPSNGTPAAPAAPLPIGDQLDQLRMAVTGGQQTPRQKIEALALVEQLAFAAADGDAAAAQQLLRAVLDAAPLYVDLVTALARRLNLNLGGS
jgi:hypothetical protein